MDLPDVFSGYKLVIPTKIKVEHDIIDQPVKLVIR